MPPVIQVHNLSKRYRIGLKEQRADTFAGQLLNVLRAPVDNFRRLRNLNRFGDEDESVFWALRDLNFDVQEGEVLGIIGHNGAGKSTLLKILSRITEPTSGEVRLRGRVSALLEVGTGFHPELTGRENVYMNGTILGMTRKEIDLKFDEIVDFSGVEKYIDTPVKFYSSGMKVRLGFAVAAHLEPEILIIDEVLAVGDAEFQRKCMGKMEDVAVKQGRTILFVSHNMAAVKSLCNNGIVLANGKIQYYDKVENAVTKYLLKNSGYSNIRKFGNEYDTGFFSLNEIKILAKGKMAEQPIDEFDELEIHTSLTMHDNSERYHYTYVLNNESGEALFTFSHANEGIKLKEGLNLLVCKLPKGFLNIGSYYLSAYLIKDARDAVFVEKDIISFNVEEGERPIGNWMGKEPGFIKPVFEWNNINIAK